MIKENIPGANLQTLQVDPYRDSYKDLQLLTEKMFSDWYSMFLLAKIVLSTVNL